MKHNLAATLVLLMFLGICVQGQKRSWEDYIEIGDDYLTSKKNTEAEKAFEDSLKLAEKFKKNDPRVAVSLVKLAEAQNRQSKTDKAEQNARNAVAALEKAIESSNSKDPKERFYALETSVSVYDKAADIFITNRKESDAIVYLLKVVALREGEANRTDNSKSNEDFMLSLAQAMNQPYTKLAESCRKLAGLYLNQSKFEDAETYYLRAMQAIEAETSEDTPIKASTKSNLGTLFAIQGKFDQAEPFYLEAIRIYQNSKQQDRSGLVTTYQNYSLLLRKTGRETEAADMFEKAKLISMPDPQQ